MTQVAIVGAKFESLSTISNKLKTQDDLLYNTTTFTNHTRYKQGVRLSQPKRVRFFIINVSADVSEMLDLDEYKALVATYTPNDKLLEVLKNA